MLTDEDCEEIGTAVGFLAIKIFKFLIEMVNEFKKLQESSFGSLRRTGFFNSDEDPKKS